LPSSSQPGGVVPQTSARGPHPVNRFTPSTPDIHTLEGFGSQIGAFSAGGALLAGGVMGALLVARRRQSRNRRPGRTIAATAPELVPVEKAAVSHARIPGRSSA
jgi:hypothetical protein